VAGIGLELRKILQVETFSAVVRAYFIGGVVVAAYVQEVSKASVEGKKYSVIENYKLMATDKRLRIVGLTLVVGQVSVLMIEPIFALFIESFKSDTKYLSTLAGGIFSISGLFMVVSAPWWGKRNDRTGYKRNLYIALAVVGVAYAGHIIVQNLVQLAFLRAFLGFARGGVLPALYSLTSLYAPPERRGGMIAIASSMTLLGNMLGPTIGGFVAGHFGIAVSFITNSCMLLITSFVIWKYMQDDPRPHVEAVEAGKAIETTQM
jgi:DHA1 family multidrug resistance protein-like MFS transporter